MRRNTHRHEYKARTKACDVGPAFLCNVKVNLEKFLDFSSQNEYTCSQNENNMLKNLITSKTRQIILKTFVESPDAEYYTRQLASLQRISVGTLHRELKKLSSAGILKARKIGNIKLFSLNKQNPVYEEIKNIIYKTEGVVKFIKDAISQIKGVKVAFIYGSFAKSDERRDSDVDIFFIVDTINEDELIHAINDVEKKLFKEINYTRYTENEYRKEKKKKNSFILEVIKGKKIFIKGDENDL
jgi:predicted nucleotidyltransferase